MTDTSDDTPRLGLRLDDSVAARIDATRVPRLQPPQAEVAGQQQKRVPLVRCPWCGYIGWASGMGDDFYILVRCSACGRDFLA